MNPSEISMDDYEKNEYGMDELLDMDTIGKKIGSMKLFETHKIDPNRCLTRIMGGWIYEAWNTNPNRSGPSSCCFIPFNSEFYPGRRR